MSKCVLSTDRATNPTPMLRAQQIGDTLGKGAFGTVFRGLNVKTGEVVAIKQIEKKLIREDQMPQIMVLALPAQRPWSLRCTLVLKSGVPSKSWNSCRTCTIPTSCSSLTTRIPPSISISSSSKPTLPALRTVLWHRHIAHLVGASLGLTLGMSKAATFTIR